MNSSNSKRSKHSSGSNRSNGHINSAHSTNIGFWNARSSNSYISELALKGRTPKNLTPITKQGLEKRRATYRKKYYRNHMRVVAADAAAKALNMQRRKTQKTRHGLSPYARAWSPKRTNKPTIRV